MAETAETRDEPPNFQTVDLSALVSSEAAGIEDEEEDEGPSGPPPLTEEQMFDLLSTKCRSAGLCFGYAFKGPYSPEELAHLETILDEATAGELWVEIVSLGREETAILVGASLTVASGDKLVVELSDLDQSEECAENHRDLFNTDTEPEWFVFAGPKVNDLVMCREEDDTEDGLLNLDGGLASRFDRVAFEDALGEWAEDDDRPHFVLAPKGL